MQASILHRGPDEQGLTQIGPVSMAHCRLAIIDLHGGKQPMRSADGKLWVAFNGEIYNYRAVRSELEALGHRFTQDSDTEVLLAAWRRWGSDSLGRLNGMFAFAIYDTERQLLTAARDRFGEKPLYYVEAEDGLYLSSELKALVAAGVVKKRIDLAALYSYFTLGYVTGPQAIFQGARRLRPGHMLTFSLKQGVAERQWYSLPWPSEEIHDTSRAVEESLSLLRDSVQLRLIADVPVGCFLSGGVDSSAVVALASEVAGKELQTFSIGFSDPRYDERPHARFVAERFHTHHHEFVLEPQSLDVLEQVAWHSDEPFADQAALPTWFLSQLTRQHVKVALSGDGGDEFFAGYDVYRSYALSEKVRRLPAAFRGLAVSALRASALVGPGSVRFLRLARNIEDAALDAPARFSAKQQTIFRGDFLRRASAMFGSTQETDRSVFGLLSLEGLSPLGAMAAWQQSVSLPDDMLHKVDRMSMAHSLEVRTPFLDHRLAEYMNRVSFSSKMTGGRQKYILRKALERYLPPEFLWRKKQGFVVPLAHWFKGDLEGLIRDRLLAPNASVHRVIPRSAIEHLLASHSRGHRDWSSALWALLMFELWCRAYGIEEEDLAVAC